MGRGRGYTDFLIGKGLLNQAPAPRPQPPAQMPVDVAQAHNLPTTDIGALTRMYPGPTTPAGDPMYQGGPVTTPPPTPLPPVPAGTVLPNQQQQAWMAWQSSTARQFLANDPSVLANADAQMYAKIFPPAPIQSDLDFLVEKGKGIVSGQMDPRDPKNFPIIGPQLRGLENAGTGIKFGVQHVGDVYDAAGNLISKASPVTDPVVGQVVDKGGKMLGPLADVVGDAAGSVGDFLADSSQGAPVDPRHQNAYQTSPQFSYDVQGQWALLNDPKLVGQANKDYYTLGDLTKDTFALYEWPINQRKEFTGDQIYKAANGEDVDEIGWDTLAPWVGMDPNTLGLPTGNFDPAEIVSDPTKAAEVKKVYDEAEQKGEDGGRAVWEWYIGQFNVYQRGLTDALGDPMNLTAVASGAGKGLAAASELAEEGSTAAKVLRAAGYALEFPDLVANAPYELPALGFRSLTWGGRAGNLERTAGKIIDSSPIGWFAGSSEEQAARDAKRIAMDQGGAGADVIGTYGPQADATIAEIKAKQAADLAAQAETNVRLTGMTPSPDIGPTADIGGVVTTDPGDMTNEALAAEQAALTTLNASGHGTAETIARQQQLDLQVGYRQRTGKTIPTVGPMPEGVPILPDMQGPPVPGPLLGPPDPMAGPPLPPLQGPAVPTPPVPNGAAIAAPPPGVVPNGTAPLATDALMTPPMSTMTDAQLATEIRTLQDSGVTLDTADPVMRTRYEQVMDEVGRRQAGGQPVPIGDELTTIPGVAAAPPEPSALVPPPPGSPVPITWEPKMGPPSNYMDFESTLGPYHAETNTVGKEVDFVGDHIHSGDLYGRGEYLLPPVEGVPAEFTGAPYIFMVTKKDGTRTFYRDYKSAGLRSHVLTDSGFKDGRWWDRTEGLANKLDYDGPRDQWVLEGGKAPVAPSTNGAVPPPPVQDIAPEVPVSAAPEPDINRVWYPEELDPYDKNGGTAALIKIAEDAGMRLRKTDFSNRQGFMLPDEAWDYIKEQAALQKVALPNPDLDPISVYPPTPASRLPLSDVAPATVAPTPEPLRSNVSVVRLGDDPAKAAGWEVHVGPNIYVPFPSRRQAEAWAKEIEENGIPLWTVDSVKGQRSSALVATNTITGEKEFFYPNAKTSGITKINASETARGKADQFLKDNQKTLTLAEAVQQRAEHLAPTPAAAPVVAPPTPAPAVPPPATVAPAAPVPESAAPAPATVAPPAPVTIPAPAPPVTTAAPDFSAIPTVAPEEGLGRKRLPGWSTDAKPLAPKVTKDFVAKQYPAQWAAITKDGHWFKDWTVSNYEPYREALQDLDSALPTTNIRGADGLKGNNRSLLPMYDREYFIKMKAALRQQGVDTSDMEFVTQQRLTEPIDDIALVESGHASNVGGTHKDYSKEAWVDTFLDSRTDNLEAAKIEALMLRSRRVEDKNPRTRNLRGYWKKKAPTDKTKQFYDADMAAYERYVDMAKQRELNRMTDNQFDALAPPAERPPEPTVVDPADTANLPKEASPWTQEAKAAVDALDPEQQAEIYHGIGDWYNDVYENGVTHGTPRRKTLADLEMGARLRTEAEMAGAPLPPSAVNYNPNDLQGMIQGAVLDPDDARAARLMDQLEADNKIVREKPLDYLAATNPDDYAASLEAFETYVKINELREMSRPHVSQGTGITTPLPRTPKPTNPAGFQALQEVDHKTWMKALEKETKRLAELRKGDPNFRVPSKGEALVDAAFTQGGITKTEADALLVNVEARVAGGTETKTMTMMDLLIEESLENPDASTAEIVRSALNRLPAPERAKLNHWQVKAGKFGRAYDFITGLYREMFQYNPASVIRGSATDALGNSMIAFLEGHAYVGLKGLAPWAHAAMIFRTATGGDIVSPVLKTAEKWGVRPGHNVVEAAARELGDDALNWSKFLGPLASGKYGMELGRHIRQAPDKLNRLNLWGDEFGRQLKIRLRGQTDSMLMNREGVTGFYDKVALAMGEGPETDAAIAELKRRVKSGESFTPTQVKEITGSAELAQEWKQTITEVKQAADAEVDRVFFNYRQTRGDAATRRVFMFHYWMSRALVQHTKLALQNPTLLYREIRLWQGLDREANRQGLHGPMAPLQMYFEFMKGDGAMYGITNPIAMITPYAMFADAFTQSYGDETTFDSWIRKSGGFLLPQIQAAAVMTGLTDRYPDAFGTATLRSTIRSILDYDRNSGNNIFHLGPGITGDPIQHWMNKVIQKVGKIAGTIDDDEGLPNLNQSKQNVAANLIIENAEADFGVPYDAPPGSPKMSDEQHAEVQAAINAVRLGQTDNDRANEALATMSSANFRAALANMVTPGGIRARSEQQTDQQRAASAYYDSPEGTEPTPEQVNAMSSQAAIGMGSTEAAALELDVDKMDFHKPVPTPLAPGASTAERDAYHDVADYNAKIDREEQAYKGWNTIVYGQLDPNSQQIINGKTYYGWEVNTMSEDNRKKLANAWLKERGADGDLDSYKARRDAAKAANPELKKYKDWQQIANNTNGGEVWVPNPRTRVMEFKGGGMRDYRTELERLSPQFNQQIDIERKRLQGDGVTGEELERRLDQWANSTEGYNAYRGVKDQINDPTVKDTSDPGKVLPVVPGQGTLSDGSSGGSSGGGSSSKAPKPPGYEGYSGKWDADNDRPAYQTKLIEDLNTYQKELDAFEAEYGPIENLSWSMKQNPQAWARIMPKPPENLESYLAWSRKQQAAGADPSLAAYIAMRDAEYAADHDNTETDSGTEVIDVTPEKPFIPAWQAAP